MVDIRTGNGLFDVLSPLCQKIRISELLEKETFVSKSEKKLKEQVSDFVEEHKGEIIEAICNGGLYTIHSQTLDNIITKEHELDLSIQIDYSGSLDYTMEGYVNTTKKQKNA